MNSGVVEALVLNILKRAVMLLAVVHQRYPQEDDLWVYD